MIINNKKKQTGETKQFLQKFSRKCQRCNVQEGDQKTFQKYKKIKEQPVGMHTRSSSFKNFVLIKHQYQYQLQ